MRTIKAIYKLPGCDPAPIELEDTLRMLQAAVGGYIEVVTLTSDLAIVCNEEGRLRELPYNCKVCGVNFVGPLLFVGVQGDGFTDVPLELGDFRLLFPALFEEVAG